MAEQLDAETVAQVLDRANALAKATIFQGNTQRPFDIQVVTLDLSTATLDTKPYKIAFPFRSCWVKKATDSSVEIFMKPQTDDSYQSAIPLSRNDLVKSDMPISNASFYWAAQSGKSVTLIFSVTSEFTSGSLISLTSGGVAISNGDSFTQAAVTIAAGTPTAIFAQSTSRKKGTVQNNHATASLWLVGPAGDSTVGIKLEPGQTFEWNNSAALYGIGDNTNASSCTKTEES